MVKKKTDKAKGSTPGKKLVKKQGLEGLRVMSRNELQEEIKKLREELSRTKLAIQAGRERQTRKAYNLRKRLARGLTILGEKKDV